MLCDLCPVIRNENTVLIDTITSLSAGLAAASTIDNFAWCLLGVIIGTAVGVLPGIGPTAALSLLLPVTFHMPLVSALIMMSGIYYGCQYGGSTASILMRMPGTAASAVTCIDGYAMTQQGRSGAALATAALASFLGAMIGVLVLIFSIDIVSSFALEFGPAEYAAVVVMSFVASCAVNTGLMWRNFAMIIVGTLLGLIGTDVTSGMVRFSLGIPELMDSVHLGVVAMGIFGVAEILLRASGLVVTVGTVTDTGSWKLLPGEGWAATKAAMRGGCVGSFFGAMPGTGPTISSMVSYDIEKHIIDSKKFGNGDIRGISAPESANNAAVQTSFVPTLCLGVPGDNMIALLLAAMIMQGVVPGPEFIAQQPELFWTLIASFVIGNLLLVILNLPLIVIWVRLLRLPYHWLYPVLLVFVAIGAYSLNNSTFDIIMVAVFGVFGVIIRLYGFQPLPVLLGFVLGPMLEENFRRALIMSQGNISIFWDTNITLVCFVISGCLILARIIADLVNKKRRRDLASGLVK